MKTLLYISFVFIFWSCKTSEQSETYTSPHFDVITLADGVYACIHKIGGKAICNIGIVDNGTETFIYDNFLSPPVAEEIQKVVDHYELSPIKYIVNSHYHNDHIRGNQVFSKEAEIISTTITADLISKNEPKEIADEKNYAPERKAYYDSLEMVYEGDKSHMEYQKILMWKSYYDVLSDSYKEVETRIPDRLVDEELRFQGSEREVRIISRGMGHTESDMIMYLPEEGILFTADLVFNRSHPYLAHGSLVDWKNWLDYLSSLKPSIVIPGHGSVGGDSTIVAMKSYIEAVETLALQMSDNDEISTDLIPEAFRDWWFDRFFPVNLAFAIEQKKIDLLQLFLDLDEQTSTPGSNAMNLFLQDKWTPLIQDTMYRRKTRELLKKNSVTTIASLARPSEPGKRISIKCFFKDADTGNPLENVKVELIQTDIHGLYFKEMSMWNPRLFTYLKSSEEGTVLVKTIMPGRYYGDGDELAPAHIHFNLEKEGYRPYAAEFWFEDDPAYSSSKNTENLPIASSVGSEAYEVIISMQKQN